MSRQFKPEIEAAIRQAAERHGVPVETLRTFARIESGGDPRNVTGSYKGLFQLSNGEFSKHGGSGDILDPVANANAAAAKFRAESADFERAHGRPPSPADLYMVHQQGAGGYAAHMANPTAPAWQNMASTAEGRQKGEVWAKQAIWGNVPDQLKAKYGSVDNMTSRDFVDMWSTKVGGGAPTVAAPAAPAANQDTPDAYLTPGAAIQQQAILEALKRGQEGTPDTPDAYLTPGSATQQKAILEALRQPQAVSTPESTGGPAPSAPPKPAGDPGKALADALSKLGTAAGAAAQPRSASTIPRTQVEQNKVLSPGGGGGFYFLGKRATS